MVVFAQAKDNKGLFYYLMADIEEEIYDYCDNYRTVPKGGQMDLFDRIYQINLFPIK